MEQTEKLDAVHTAWKQGIFLELQRPEGAMETPMWISMRERLILTKQINQATVFTDMQAAVQFLGRLEGFDSKLFDGALLVPTVRTYNAYLHGIFWERLAVAKEGKEDYSYYLTRAQQQLDQLTLALNNGPREVAAALPRELLHTIFDLAISVDRRLKEQEALDESFQQMG